MVRMTCKCAGTFEEGETAYFKLKVLNDQEDSFTIEETLCEDCK